MSVMTYLEAISDALRVEMRADPDVFVMGEDVGGEFGGAFKVTKGFDEEFGERRVKNMPMTELGFIGAANGMALMGLRPVVEMQFADFISTGFDSIVQYAATTHYRWKAAVPWVIRAPSDGGIRSGPFHSQNPEAWFVHTPGLKVVAPSTPADAKGLLISAIRDNNPVIYFESKPLYRSLEGEVPEGDHTVPIGSASVARMGSDVTVVTYGAMVHQALAAAADLEGSISVEVIDLRTLKPLDIEGGSRLGPQDGASGGGPRRQPAGRHRCRGGGHDRGARIRTPRRTGDTPRRTRHSGSVQPPARRRLPAWCHRNRIGRAQGGCVLNGYILAAVA